MSFTAVAENGAEDTLGAVFRQDRRRVMKLFPLQDGKVLTYRNVAMPWQCDQNRHVNTRFYMEFFDSAGSALLSMLGHSMATAKKTGFGWVDARAEVVYLKELNDGETFTIWSGIHSLGTTSIKYFHELYAEDRAEPSARCEAVMVHFDLTWRMKHEMPSSVRNAAAALLPRS
jgi:acyl-CoA thioester hydrolase